MMRALSVTLATALGAFGCDGSSSTVDPVADALVPAGDTSPAPDAFSGVPVTSGQVVQHELQAIALEPRLDLGGLEGIGEQELNGFEARLGGGLEAVEEGMLVEEHRQVGGELWHVGVLQDQ